MAKQVVDKKKQTIKKRWFPIVAPKLFNEVVIGESLLYDASEAVGRGSAANLMQLTGDARAQNTTIKFSITEARDNKLFTAPKEYLLSVTAIKRLIRRKQDKIEDSISVSTSDGKRIRIKPLVLTRGKTKSSVQKLLRKTIRQEMIGFVRKHARLIFYMISREYFSLRQVIDYSLANGDFKSEAVWDTKGKFKDRMVEVGWLHQYSYEDINAISAESLVAADQYYRNNNKKKRSYLSFNVEKLISAVLLGFTANDNTNELNAILSNQKLLLLFSACLRSYALFIEQNYQASVSFREYLELFIIGMVKAASSRKFANNSKPYTAIFSGLPALENRYEAVIEDIFKRGYGKNF